MARLPAILCAAALGLGLVVIWQTVAPAGAIEEDATAQAVPVTIAPPLSARFVPPPLAQFAVINARPLFDPARQPVEEPAPAGTISTTPPDVTLVGVAIGPSSAIALLKRSNVKNATTVRVGDDVDGWKVDRIAADRVVLRSGVATFDVPMRAAAGTPNPPPPAGQTAAPADQAGQ